MTEPTELTGTYGPEGGRIEVTLTLQPGEAADAPPTARVHYSDAFSQPSGVPGDPYGFEVVIEGDTITHIDHEYNRETAIEAPQLAEALRGHLQQIAESGEISEAEAEYLADLAREADASIHLTDSVEAYRERDSKLRATDTGWRTTRFLPPSAYPGALQMSVAEDVQDVLQIQLADWASYTSTPDSLRVDGDTLHMRDGFEGESWQADAPEVAGALRGAVGRIQLDQAFSHDEATALARAVYTIRQTIPDGLSEAEAGQVQQALNAVAPEAPTREGQPR